MLKLTPRTIILVAALAFLIGLLSPYINSWISNTPIAAAPIEPEQDRAPIVSDAFTLRLLKAATVAQPQGNIVLAPDSLATVLRAMLPLASPEVEQALNSLQLPAEQQISSTLHTEATYLFADSAAELTGEHPHVFDEPITTDRPRAFSEINLRLQGSLGREIGTPANSDTINSNTNLLTFNGINITTHWKTPVNPANSRAGTFYNANGSLPQVLCMSVYTERYTECPQGSWKAAAIRLDRSPRAIPETPDCYLIIIQPTGNPSARPFAADLTTEQFSAIRTALRESTRSCSTLLPRLDFATPPHDITPLLQALDIDPLFTSATPFSKLTSASPWPFTGAMQYCRVRMAESTKAAVDARPVPETEHTFDCNRPFIWCLMPLSSPHAPFAMGVVENL